MQFDPPRELTQREREVLEFLLSEPFPGRDELRQQVKHVLVREQFSPSDPTIILCFPTRPRPAPVQSPIPVEAETIGDPPGDRTQVLLHVHDGYVHELEFYEEGGKDAYLPEPRQLKLYHPPDAAAAQ